MNPTDLEHLVDAELKRLPAVRAPRTLLPRLLAVAAAEQHRQPTGGWSVWSRGWQLAGGSIAVVVLIGMWRLVSFAGPYVAPLLSNSSLDRTASVTRRADDLAVVARVLWEMFIQPAATYVSILAISLALACALLWSAVERLAPGGASHR
jgi:hypothetical protein